MRQLGTIIRLQVQVDLLKKGENPNRYYDPAGIASVPALRLERDGAVGLEDGHELADVHHIRHPKTRQHDGINALSFNFIGHYDRMQQRFGPHLTLGCAGESIIVDGQGLFAAEQFAGGVIVRSPSGQETRLDNVCVAAPCAPFSEFALAMETKPSADAVKTALQFLDGGMRGFYCRYDGKPVVIYAGDTLWLP